MGILDLLLGRQKRSPKESRISVTGPSLIDMILGREPKETKVERPKERKEEPKEENNIEEKIRKGLINYVGEDAPVLEFVPQMVEATKKYDIFKNNPFLLPTISILETSGGRNITRPNNLLNWGINYPGNNLLFSLMSQQDVLGRAISGLGERSSYYEPFRTGESMSEEDVSRFARTYEPANLSYGSNLWEGMKFFEEQ